MNIDLPKKDHFIGTFNSGFHGMQSPAIFALPSSIRPPSSRTNPPIVKGMAIITVSLDISYSAINQNFSGAQTHLLFFTMPTHPYRTSSDPTNPPPTSIVTTAKGTVGFRVNFYCLDFDCMYLLIFISKYWAFFKPAHHHHNDPWTTKLTSPRQEIKAFYNGNTTINIIYCNEERVMNC